MMTIKEDDEGKKSPEAFLNSFRIFRIGDQRGYNFCK